jgi:hypothetical protein
MSRNESNGNQSARTPNNTPQPSGPQSNSVLVNGEANRQAQNSTPNHAPENPTGPTQLSAHLPSATTEESVEDKREWEGASNSRSG